jgi:glyoxylase-like metal-dependent hydrolase (beta-lactamase superfamily II)
VSRTAATRPGPPDDLAHPVRVLAPNPGPYTLEGTNTWIVGRGPSLVIDPGPEDPIHLERVRRVAGPVAAILLTHRHPDHALGAAWLGDRTGAPVMAFRAGPGEERLASGRTVEADGTRLRVIHTPGHTKDHVVFHDAASGALFTGDMVLGRGTSIVDPPEGEMAAYVRSLEAMAALRPTVLYPGHGPTVWSAGDKLREYVEHRAARERQVLAGLTEGPRSPKELVGVIYSDYPADLRPLAARSVLAHLLKLEAEGRVERQGRGAGLRFAVATPGTCARCGRPVRVANRLCDRCRLAVLQEGPGST